MKKLLFVSILLLIVLATTVKAQYYVSVTGSDANPGTSSQPFKTIQKAANVLQAGDTCYIMAGIYRETVIPLNNGTSTNHIVFKNYMNDKVFIVGTDSISGWTSYQNGIYKAYAPDTVLQLCVNKKIANEARYPNFNGNHMTTSDWSTVSIDTMCKALFTGMNFPAGYWNGGYCIANVGSKWVCEIGTIDSSLSNAVYCSQTSWPWGSHPAYSPTVYTGSGRGYIMHHLNALDTINEWHWQNDTLYYYPQSPSIVNTMDVEARTRMFAFNCYAKQYIDIENINIVFANVTFEEATGCTLNNSSVVYPTPFFYYSLSWDRQAHDSINYGITKWQGKGVTMSGYNNNILNCYIAHSWGDGISIGGTGNTVDNCLVEDCDWSATDDAVLSCVGTGHNIKHSTLHNTCRSTLVNRLCNLTNIMYNNMYDCGYITLDLGITYSYRSNGGGSQIAYNWCHDNHCTSTSNMGIYLDNADTAYIVHHNVIWNCKNALQTNKPAVNHQIYNNTVWFCTKTIGTWGTAGQNIVNQIVKNNLSNLAWDQGTTFSNNLVTQTPNFTNAAGFDFTLTFNSPAIDVGDIIPGFTDGYVGIAPDAGAYEYGLTPWVPGSVVQKPDISEVLIDSSQVTTGINNEMNHTKEDGGLNVYPNPTNSKLYIDYNNIENTQVAVFNIFGQRIIEKSKCNSLDLTAYNKGLYLLVLNDKKKNITISRMIVLD